MEAAVSEPTQGACAEMSRVLEPPETLLPNREVPKHVCIPVTTT